MKKPWKKSEAGITRSPPGPTATISASSSAASMHHSPKDPVGDAAAERA
jgi:hypothetical protein